MLLAWENEAYLALKELGEDQFDIVAPSVSVRAAPPVARVEGKIKTDESRKLAEAYLTLLYSAEGQALAWILVRFRFPGRRILGAAVDLPFALPTAVVGITLTAL